MSTIGYQIVIELSYECGRRRHIREESSEAMPHCINLSASAKCETEPLLSWRSGIICNLFCALSFENYNLF